MDATIETCNDPNCTAPATTYNQYEGHALCQPCSDVWGEPVEPLTVSQVVEDMRRKYEASGYDSFRAWCAGWCKRMVSDGLCINNFRSIDDYEEMNEVS